MSHEIRLNGKLEAVEEGLTLLDLLARKGVNPARVAVEFNREILARANFATTRLKAGDEVEVVTFVGGG